MLHLMGVLSNGAMDMATGWELVHCCDFVALVTWCQELFLPPSTASFGMKGATCHHWSIQNRVDARMLNKLSIQKSRLKLMNWYKYSDLYLKRARRHPNLFSSSPTASEQVEEGGLAAETQSQPAGATTSHALEVGMMVRMMKATAAYGLCVISCDAKIYKNGGHCCVRPGARLSCSKTGSGQAQCKTHITSNTLCAPWAPVPEHQCQALIIGAGVALGTSGMFRTISPRL
jgi:hypothetical protein